MTDSWVRVIATRDGSAREPDGLAVPIVMGPLLRSFAATRPDVPAIEDGSGIVTYSQLEQRSAELAARLLELGTGRGDRVGILLPNGVDWLVTFAAVTRIGAVAAPLSTLSQAPELSWLLRAASVEAVVTAAEFRGHDYLTRFEQAIPGLEGSTGGDRPLFIGSAPRLRRVIVVGEHDRAWAARPASPAPNGAALLERVEDEVAAHDPLVIIHTSGSTAEPKGVIHSHGAFLGHTATMSASYLPLSVGDRTTSSRPWFWIAGLAADLFYALHAGSTFVVPDDGSAESVAALVSGAGLGYVGGSGLLFRQLAAMPELRSAGLDILPLGIDLAGVAEELEGGLRFRSDELERRIPAATARAFEPARFPNLFGMTETIGTHSGLPHGTQLPADRSGASGPPVPGMEHRIVDPDTGADLPPGQEGELLVRGRSLMLGLDRSSLGSERRDGGWYPTGDMCRRDPDGWVTFRSRLGDVVKVSGANVAPLEVERVLAAHDGVEEVAVVGVDGATGAVLTAFVVPSDAVAVDVEDLREWVASRLSSYKRPREYVLVRREDLPRTASGKVRKHVLREWDGGSHSDPPS